jgi:hypothetical protein
VPATLSPQQVLALAPDAASAAAGRGLASARKWVTVGADARAVWGECQGSGRNPYQTIIDLEGPSFKCSCPSRKFPCKHSLGLLLLRATEAGAFPPGAAPPPWVEEWIRSREARSERAAKKEATPPADPEAKARRAERSEAARSARVASGLKELDLWLRDMLRRGLASAQQQPSRYWETMAARLVDAQAPGAARMVRDLAGIPASGEGWPERLAERLSRLILLLEAYRRIDSLGEETRADVRAALGWSMREEEILTQSGVQDCWVIVGQRVTEEDRLRVQRTWLIGCGSGRPALILRFAAANQPLDLTFLPGVAMEGECAFWPGRWPLRALPKQLVPSATDGLPPAHPDLARATADFAGALAQNPWLEQFPLLLDGVVPVPREGGWLLKDSESRCLAITPAFGGGWRLLAVSGGHPVTVFGEWDGNTLLPLGAWAGDAFISFGGMR